MTTNERVKAVRKSLGLTLEKFGEKIGIKKAAVSKIENGENSLTDSNLKSICREFNVDYMWLTTGNGEMFVNTDDAALTMIDNIMSGENDFHKNLLKACASLDMDDLKVIEKLIDKFLEIKKAGK